MIRFNIFALIALTIPISYGAQKPTAGLLDGVSEKDSLFYSCESLSQGTILCDFNQMRVRKDKTQGEAIDEIKSRLDAWDDPENKEKIAKRYSKSKCDLASKRMASLATEQIDSDFEKKLRQRSSKDRLEYQILLAEKSLDLCTDPSRKNWESLVRMQVEKELGTCTVSANEWQRELKKVANADIWYVQDKPRNVCGTLDVSRFQLNKETNRWEYFSQKKVLNPDEEWLVDTKCSELDEKEYRYADI